MVVIEAKQRILNFFLLTLLGWQILSLQDIERRPVPNPLPSDSQGKSVDTSVLTGFRKTPVLFERNIGQAEGSVRFLSRTQEAVVLLKPTELTVEVSAKSNCLAAQARSGKTNHCSEGRSIQMEILGANQEPEIAGEGEQATKIHYMIGNDSGEWHLNVPTYARVRYRNIYPGIDLVYYDNQRRLEYDLVVAPGADPEAIRLSFDGSDLRLDSNGNLLLASLADTNGAYLSAPNIYQDTSEGRKQIEGGFNLGEGGEVSFEISPYDSSKPLIIDPVLVYASYLGGSGSDWAGAEAADENGSLVVGGMTGSANFPKTNAIQPDMASVYDAFITKFSPDGTSLLFSTFLGGGGEDQVTGIAIDPSGNIYLAGRTASVNFPVVNPFQASPGSPTVGGDAFFAKLSANGSSILYSSYLGGERDDVAQGIAVDSSGNVYLTGLTTSNNFPLAPNSAITMQAFITKVDSSGLSLSYVALISNGTSPVSGRGIAVDAQGNAYAVGDAYPDALVAKINPAGTAFVYLGLLGGGNADTNGLAIAADNSGNAYVTGVTTSANFPITPGAHKTIKTGLEDGFFSKINPNGSLLLYSTYFGGSAGEGGRGIAVRPNGDIYIGGETSSNDFPAVNAFQSEYGGGADAFVMKFSASGALLFSSYLGGSGSEGVARVVFDASENAYFVGGTTGGPLLSSSSSFQPNFGGGFNDVLVMKLALGASRKRVGQLVSD